MRSPMNLLRERKEQVAPEARSWLQNLVSRLHQNTRQVPIDSGLVSTCQNASRVNAGKNFECPASSDVAFKFVLQNLVEKVFGESNMSLQDNFQGTYAYKLARLSQPYKVMSRRLFPLLHSVKHSSHALSNDDILLPHSPT